MIERENEKEQKVKGKEKKLDDLLPSIPPHVVARKKHPLYPARAEVLDDKVVRWLGLWLGLGFGLWFGLGFGLGLANPDPNPNLNPNPNPDPDPNPNQVRWDTPWPDYAPTHFEAEVLAENVRGGSGGGWADPAEIAAVIAFLLSPEASYVHGAIIPVDGGYLAA